MTTYGGLPPLIQHPLFQSGLSSSIWPYFNRPCHTFGQHIYPAQSSSFSIYEKPLSIATGASRVGGMNRTLISLFGSKRSIPLEARILARHHKEFRINRTALDKALDTIYRDTLLDRNIDAPRDPEYWAVATINERFGSKAAREKAIERFYELLNQSRHSLHANPLLESSRIILTAIFAKMGGHARFKVAGKRRASFESIAEYFKSAEEMFAESVGGSKDNISTSQDH